MNETPAISVIMHVYPTAKLVSEAIQSMLDQTFNDFELIIVNEGSNRDRNSEIIHSFKDGHIKILFNNPGETPSFITALNHAKGRYVSIIDTNTIVLPQKLERQFLFMESHPLYGITGCGYSYFGKENNVHPDSDYELIKVKLLRDNCFLNSTILIRRNFLEQHNLQQYCTLDYSYMLMAKAASYFPITNIKEVLQYLVPTEQQIKQNALNDEIRIQQLLCIGISLNDEEKHVYLNFVKGNSIEYGKISVLFQLVENIKKKNVKIGYYRQDYLNDFMETLMKQQVFIRQMPINSFRKPNFSIHNQSRKKLDLSDLTFLIPVRIDSDYRMANLDVLITLLTRDFKTNVIVLEADIIRRVFQKNRTQKFSHHFVFDEDTIFHKTKYVNMLIRLATTPFVAIWDTDAIGIPEQIDEAMDSLRNNTSIMAYPFDGRFFSLNSVFSNIFYQVMNYDLLLNNISMMHLMHGYYSPGGAYLVNKDKYLQAGGENENIYGWGPEDAERIKRMEVLNLPIYYVKGPLFHLWHPSKNWFANSKIESRNRKEFLKTCALLKS